MDLLAGAALDAAPPPPADVKASMKAYLQSSREGPEPKDAPGYPWNNDTFDQTLGLPISKFAAGTFTGTNYQTCPLPEDYEPWSRRCWFVLCTTRRSGIVKK
jgi:hypothetical protein